MPKKNKKNRTLVYVPVGIPALRLRPRGKKKKKVKRAVSPLSCPLFLLLLRSPSLLVAPVEHAATASPTRRARFGCGEFHRYNDTRESIYP